MGMGVFAQLALLVEASQKVGMMPPAPARQVDIFEGHTQTCKTTIVLFDLNRFQTSRK